MNLSKETPPYQDIQQIEWTQKIRNALNSLKNKETLVLSSILDFEWDKMYIFSENLPGSAINQELGFAWVDQNFSVAELTDILVFVKNGRVVNYLIITGDIFVATDIKGINREDAIFEARTIDDPSRPKVFIPIQTQPY